MGLNLQDVLSIPAFLERACWACPGVIGKVLCSWETPGPALSAVGITCAGSKPDALKANVVSSEGGGKWKARPSHETLGTPELKGWLEMRTKEERKDGGQQPSPLPLLSPFNLLVPQPLPLTSTLYPKLWVERKACNICGVEEILFTLLSDHLFIQKLQ